MAETGFRNMAVLIDEQHRLVTLFHGEFRNALVGQFVTKIADSDVFFHRLNGRDGSSDNDVATHENHHRHQNVDVAVAVACRGVLRRHVVQLRIQPIVDFPIKKIDARADHRAPNKPDENVARIMHAEIHPRPTIQQRPRDKHRREQATSDEKREKQGYRERIGSVGREKSVVRLAVIIHHINRVFDDGVVGRSPPRHVGFRDEIGQSVCKEKTNQTTQHNEENLRHILIVLDDDVKECQIERNPRQSRCKRHSDGIEKQRVAPVEKRKHLTVKFQ